MPTTPAEWEQLEGALFGASLFPYLAFLYFLGKEETNAPPLANTGFRFLLVFVFGSIPAAIAAKLLYGGAVLADVDPLHGAAESLLTITNLLIVLGFRQGLREAAAEANSGGAATAPQPDRTAPRLAAVGAAGASAALLVPGIGIAGSESASALLGWHAEPANALSIPTWAIHVSSLVEWVIAMGYIWQYAEASGNPRWRGLTLAMIPCHSSGLCAVTWHLLYNSPALAPVVAAQAALTTFGNTTIAFAAWRIASFEAERALDRQQAGERGGAEQAEAQEHEQGTQLQQATEKRRARAARDAAEALGDDGSYVLNLTAASVVAAAALKWGSLAVDPLFAPSNALAFSIVGAATAANVLKWSRNSAAAAEAAAVE